ncbi:hypothetical protein IIC65_01920, partial [Candidatus Sumerlaeota bacterium]|nr:hypothetical protein [Candidatus Sumerlaeota bacterium]
SEHVFREMGERQIALGFEDWNGELDDVFSTVEPAGEIHFENDSVLGQLIAFPNFSSLTGAGDPLGWTRLGATAGNSDAEGRYVLEQNEWYRTKLIRLPNLTGVSVRMDIDQLSWAPTGDDFTVGLDRRVFVFRRQREVLRPGR